MVLGKSEMIKVGDIVYQKRVGGIIQGVSDVITKRLGLVIKEYKEKGAIPQFYVKFDQEDPKWYHHHHLHRISWRERNKND